MTAQGTLLGLYPNCLKTIAFGARVGLLCFLRTLLVQPFARLHACMQRLPYIAKLSVMEHLCNTIYDFHPGICHTLNRSGQKVEHFCNSVSTICDIFRGELNTLFCAESTQQPSESAAVVLLRILPRLERIAHSYFERCTRAYRGIIIGSIQPLHHIDHARRLCTGLTASEGRSPLERLLDGVSAACSHSVFDLVHAHTLPLPAHRELAWHLTQIVQAHVLPKCIMERQLTALRRRYSGDTTCVSRCRVLHLCIQCVVRRGSVQGTRLRHDCLTGELTCMYCGAGTVLTIDLLGRIVTVAKEQLLLSSCCGSFIYYSGSGHEFSTECGQQCAGARQLYRKRERSSVQAAPAAAPPLVCLICGPRGGGQTHSVQQVLPLLDPVLRRVAQHGLCGRHAVPQHILRRIYDKNELLRFFQQRPASSSSSSSRRHHTSSCC